MLIYRCECKIPHGIISPLHHYNAIVTFLVMFRDYLYELNIKEMIQVILDPLQSMTAILGNVGRM